MTHFEPRFTSDASRTTAQKSLIDCHVHLAALPDGDNGCFISPKLLRSPLFQFLLWKQDLSPAHPREANQRYLDHLLTELRSSRYVQKVVLLGMDGFYDQTGLLNRQHTDFLVSNDYVFKSVRDYPDVFLAGPSINPQREDAIDEVHRCADAGAVLIKVLPNAQHFNPADERYKAFYRALAQRRLPFLSHVGYEFSLIGKDQSLGDPDRLRLALDEGVTVIAAHACSYGLMLYEKFLPTFRELCERYPNFYADISALTQPHRLKMLLHLRHYPERNPACSLQWTLRCPSSIWSLRGAWHSVYCCAHFNKINPDLSSYVVSKALDALFGQVAKEEANIRANPMARTTDILKKVFGQ